MARFQLLAKNAQMFPEWIDLRGAHGTVARAERTDIATLRKQFQALHSSLRNEGHNPLEAVRILAATIQPGQAGNDAAAQLSDRVKALLDSLTSQPQIDSAALSVAFQQFLASEARNGLGQYLTPLPVVDFIARFAADLEPRSLLDPFAGSGLLLERMAEHRPALELFGIEINRSAAVVAQAVAQLSRHRITINVGDAFALWASGNLPPVDAVITNPPFGALATTVTVSDLSAIGVATSLLRLRSLPAELLGLELSVSVLRDGGFLGIVLPQSVFTNTSWAAYRVSLFQRIQPVAVISLPEETFAPFRGVAKACVFFAQKRPGALPVSFPYIRSRTVGYDDTGRATKANDLPEILDDLRNQRSSACARIDSAGDFLIPPALESGVEPAHCLVLGDIATVFTGKTLPRNSYVSHGPRLLKVGDLRSSFIAWRWRPRCHVPPTIFAKNKRYHLAIGDICLTAAAHRPHYIGMKVDLVDALPADGAMASAEVLVIRLAPKAPILPEQLLYYLRTKAGYSQLQDLVRGSTAHIYPADVARLLIPPLSGTISAEELRKHFWEAAAAFRLYLKLEAEAARLGTPAGTTALEDLGEDEDA